MLSTIDSIVGIRSKALEVNDAKKVVTVIESSPPGPASSCLVGPSSSNVSPQSTHSRPGGKAITATTATSPGLPVLPYYSEQQQQQQHSTLPAPVAAIAGSASMPPIIIVTSDDPVRTDGSMLDRISHDLDYLLNRTAGADGSTGTPSSTVVPIQLRPTSAGPSGTLATVGTPGPGLPAHPSQSSISAPLVPTCHGVHEVIIEESEEVDS